MPVQCRQNFGTMPEQCWNSARTNPAQCGTMSVQCQHNATHCRHKPAQCRHNARIVGTVPGTMPAHKMAQFRHKIGTMSAQQLHNTGQLRKAQCRQILAQSRRNAGIVLNTMLDTMPAQYRHNACKMPVHCRNCANKIVAQYLCNFGTISTLCRHNANNISA